MRSNGEVVVAVCGLKLRRNPESAVQKVRECLLDRLDGMEGAIGGLFTPRPVRRKRRVAVRA